MGGSVTEALSVVIGALEADGYGAEIEQTPEVVSFRITAGPEACEECLSPRAVIEPLISGALRKAGFTQRLELAYPGAEH